MNHNLMRHLARFRRAVLTLAVTSAPSVAQSAADTAAFRLDDALRTVLNANPRLRASRALARAAEHRIPGTTRPPDPEVQLGIMNRALPGFGPMAILGMTQLQVMQMVPVAGKLGLARDIADARAAATSSRADEVGWEVRTAAAMAFYDLYVAEQTLALTRGTLRLLQDIHRTAESMYRVGEGRQADVLRASVEVARMVEDTVRMVAMRLAMTAQLNALGDQPPDLVRRAPVLPAFPATLPTLPQLLAQGERRAMVRAGGHEHAAATAAVTLARREIWPDVTIGIQYGQQRATMGGGPRATDRMASVMIGARVPIFAGVRQGAMRDEALAMQEMAAADLAVMRADTRTRVATAHAVLERAHRLVSLYRHTVIPQAQATVTSALAAYRVGAVDFMTLLDDQMAVNNYRQQLVTLEADEGKAWAELEMLTASVLVDPAATRAPGGDL